MTAPSTETSADIIESAGDRLTPVVIARDGGFRAAILIAALLHLPILAGAGRSHPRIIGDEKGAPDAIAVSLVTEADLKDETGSTPAAPLPPNELKPALTETPPVPQEKPQQPAETQPEPTEPTPPEKAQAAEETKRPEVQDIPDLLSIDKDVQPEAVKKPAQKPQPKKPPVEKSEAKPRSEAKKTAKLDLSAPTLTAPSFAGRSAAFERPPGITRSGENDEFARRVIAALQQTMPQLSAVRGRGTIRIFLDNNGNVLDVKLIATSNIADIDQSIVFAARQTSYPFPPNGANEADRTFVVTYIYN
jgi:protein TonB